MQKENIYKKWLMVTIQNNNLPPDDQGIVIRKVGHGDFDAMLEYFNSLSHETRSRFGPHAFDRDTLIRIYLNSLDHIGYVAAKPGSEKIIGYSVLKIGYLEHDYERLCSFGFIPDARLDVTYAPSVADEWQSRGVGRTMLKFIVNSLSDNGFRRIILWGGVQASNEKAVNFYRKAGFRELGTFEYNGLNIDMVLDNIHESTMHF